MLYIHIGDNSTKSINWQVSYNPSGVRGDGRFQIWLIFSLVGTQWRILLVSSKIMPASKLAAQHSPCTLLQRLPSRDNSSKRVKLLRLMGSPLFPSPYPPPRFVVGSFGFVGWNWVLRHSEKEELGYQLLVFSCQLSVSTLNSQLPTSNFQLITDH